MKQFTEVDSIWDQNETQIIILIQIKLSHPL